MAFLMTYTKKTMEQRAFFIKTIILLITFILSLTVFSITERTVLAESSATSSEIQVEVTEGQIVPETGELPPAPELTPEERERLIRGTEIQAPHNEEDSHCLTDDSSEQRGNPLKE